MSYESVILVCWVSLILVWIVASFDVKRDVRSSGLSGILLVYRSFILQVIGTALVVFTAWKIVTATGHYANAGAAIFRNGSFTLPLALGWVAATLTALGILFAIWARFNLGRNWSSTPAVKENHELVTSGPYRFVRHPIYTGILLAAFGTALTGTLFGIGVFLIASVMF